MKLHLCYLFHYPKGGGCGVSLEVRLNYITLCNLIKVPATTLVAKRTYYISMPLRNVRIQYYPLLSFYGY